MLKNTSDLRQVVTLTHTLVDVCFASYPAPPVRCRRWRCGLFLDLRGEGRRGQISDARVRPHRVEVPPPSLDDDLRLGTRAKPFEAEALVAELAVETLADPVLLRLARIDERRTNTLVHDPLQYRARDEFRPVVAAQELRRASFADQTAERLAEAGIEPSVGSVGDSYDNALA